MPDLCSCDELLNHMLVLYKYLLLIFLLPMIFSVCFGIQLQNYKSISKCHHSDTELPNELLMICTHQDLLHVRYPLFAGRVYTTAKLFRE